MGENSLDLEATIANAEANIKLGEAFLKLAEMPEFQLVFQDKFIDAFAITNVQNMGTYDTQKRAQVHEKMVARGHFTSFCGMIIQDYQEAAQTLEAVRSESDNTEDHN